MKSHYQNSDAGGGTGLDELAGIVVSSGLSSSRLTRSPRKMDGSSVRQNVMPVIVGAGVIVIVLIFVIIYMATRTSAPVSQSIKSTGEPSSAVLVVPMNTPNFCGTALQGNSVIYLLDCGVATQDFLGELKDATIKSIATLGSNRKFCHSVLE